MPDNNGNYTLPPGYLASPGGVIRTSQHNPIFEDVRDAMNRRLMTTGDNPMTGDLPMGGNKITGLSDPAAAQDGATKAYVDGEVTGLSNSLGTAATVDHGTDPGEVPLNSDIETKFVKTADKATQSQAEGGVTGDVWMDDIRVRQAIQKQRPEEYYIKESMAGSGWTVVSPMDDIMEIVISTSGLAVSGSDQTLFLRVAGSESAFAENEYTVISAGGTGLVEAGTISKWLRWDISTNQFIIIKRMARTRFWHLTITDRTDGKTATAYVRMSIGDNNILNGFNLTASSGESFTAGTATALVKGFPG